MRTSKILIIGIVLVMTFALTMSAMARGHGHRGDTMGTRLMGLKTFIELQLTESQQETLLNIITRHQSEGFDTRERMLEAKKNMRRLMQAEELNEAEIRKAFQEVSQIKEERFVSRARMLVEMKKVLSPEQISLLEDRKAQRFARMKDRLEFWQEMRGE
jgi:Spy/CpxP family protein refolding chaperone